MSYEICVYQPQTAADRETASDIWNNERLWDMSLPDHDRSAPKWRVKDLLLAFDSRLKWTEPKAPKTGLFAKWFGKPAVVQHCLHMYLEDDYGETAIDLFDQGIEITLPWEPPRDEAEKHVRALWRYLECLSAAGWSTMYDTERDVLLNLDTDFEAVKARYLENLGPDDDDNAAASPVAASPSARASQPETAGGKKNDKPFTGNVE